MLAGWSWWQIVLTVGLVWTASSFLIALALARVLRANLAFDVDAAAGAPEPSSADDDEEEDSGAEWAGPLATSSEPSLLDQLLPADLADESATGHGRSSGTRFRPVTGASNVQPLRRRIG